MLLAQKMEKDKQEHNKLKTLVEKSHRVKLDRKATQHEANIKTLDSVISSNRDIITTTVTELEKLHQSELEAKLMEAEFEKEIWELERDVQLDKIILEKMELQKVQDRIKILEVRVETIFEDYRRGDSHPLFSPTIAICFAHCRTSKWIASHPSRPWKTNARGGLTSKRTSWRSFSGRSPT